MQIGKKFSPCCPIALHLTLLFLMPSPLQPLLPGIINYSYMISSILAPLKRQLAEEMTDLGWFGSVNFPVLCVYHLPASSLRQKCRREGGTVQCLLKTTLRTATSSLCHGLLSKASHKPNPDLRGKERRSNLLWEELQGLIEMVRVQRGRE